MAPSCALLGLVLASTSALHAAKPSRLVVLQHGLYGSAANLELLRDEIYRLGGDDVVVICASSVEGVETRRGIRHGGTRLAGEVKAAAKEYPTLQSLVMVGNSLGGLYARFAAAQLFDLQSGTMAGLRPDALITFGCPHLGVRRFTYIPLPSTLHPLAPVLAGRTADELLLREQGEAAGQPLLLEMSQPSSRFGAALRAFERRRLYANLRGDFMVPFGTAAIEADGWGAGLGDAFRASRFVERAAEADINKRVLRGELDGIGVQVELAPKAAAADVSLAAVGEDRWEAVMAANLNGFGWSKVGCQFRTANTLLPMAHNKLAALRREGWRKAFELVEGAHEGRVVICHAAEYIMADAQ